MEYYADGMAYTVTHYPNEEPSPQEELAIMDALDRLAFDKWSKPGWIRVSLESQLIGSLLWRGKALTALTHPTNSRRTNAGSAGSGGMAGP